MLMLPKFLYILLLPLTLLISGKADPPVNKGVEHLFRIERSRDANKIYYDLNGTSGRLLSEQEPLSIYWIKHAEDGRKEPLTWIQRNYSYGVEFTRTSPSEAEFNFVSYKARKFIVKRYKQTSFKVFTQLKGKEVIVNQIFVQIDGGTFWFPEISKVELHYLDPVSGIESVEKIYPN